MNIRIATLFLLVTLISLHCIGGGIDAESDGLATIVSRPKAVIPGVLNSSLAGFPLPPSFVDKGIWPELNPLVRFAKPIGAINTEDAFNDLDNDGIPNQLDGLLGAKKTVLNAASYDGKYVTLSYPNGDVPRKTGVCTDVVIRTLRNAGLDLQKEMQKDFKKSPHSYPRIKTGNPSIDHRRVKNLQPWFQRHWRVFPADNLSTFLPGDVIFMDTLPNLGPDHIGIVSDRLIGGRPQIINNWTYGAVTKEMDLLPFVTVTAHYRWKNRSQWGSSRR